MAGEYVDALLIKLGLETDRQEFAKAESMFNSLRGGAMGAAGSMAAVGAGINSMLNKADRLGTLSRHGDQLDTTAAQIDAVGYALERAGGSSENAISTISTAQSLLDQLQVGNAGAFEDAAQWINVDEIMAAQSGMEALLELSEELEGKSAQRQRNALEALGLDGVGQFGALTQGREHFEETLERGRQMATISGELVNNSRQLNQSLVDLDQAFEGITNELTDRYLPALAKGADMLADFFGDEKSRSAAADFVQAGPIGAVRGAGDDYIRENLPGQANWLTMSVSEGLSKAWDWATGSNDQSISDQAIRAAISVSTPHSIPVDQPRNAGVDAPGSIPVDDVDQPRDVAVDAPGSIPVDQPRNVGVDAPRSIPVDDVDPVLLEAVMWQESRGRHRDASGNLTTNPSSGARGAYQIMPATARDPGYGIEPLRNDSPAENRRLADDYLDAMMDLFDDNTSKALAAYNAGPGNVQDAVDEYGKQWMAHMPAETQLYVPQVMERYSQQGGSSTTTVTNHNTFHIEGSKDPAATANEVERILRRTADQTREDTANAVY